MEEKNLYRISLMVALFGLGILFLYAQEVDLKAIESIETRPVDETVKIKGTLSKLSTSDKVLFLKVEGERTETTDIIFFPDDDIFLQEGDYVEVTGKIEEYKGKKEIIADKVVLGYR